MERNRLACKTCDTELNTNGRMRAEDAQLERSGKQRCPHTAITYEQSTQGEAYLGLDWGACSRDEKRILGSPVLRIADDLGIIRHLDHVNAALRGRMVGGRLEVREDLVPAILLEPTMSGYFLATDTF
jgi:hypothetical protein